jgi:hypothetical protein
MNCREFWNTMPQSGGAHPHLIECAECSARMEEERELAAGLRAVAASMSRTGAPARVEGRLISAFRAHNRLPRTAPVRPIVIPSLAWAAALAAMIAVALLIVRERAPEARHVSPAVAVAQVAETLAVSSEAISNDGFVPLPGAEELPAADDLDMVSIEVPRSAMMQVGIEVSPERAAETVLADVMVGSDGMARAVRFREAEGSD